MRLSSTTPSRCRIAGNGSSDSSLSPMPSGVRRFDSSPSTPEQRGAAGLEDRHHPDHVPRVRRRDDPGSDRVRPYLGLTRFPTPRGNACPRPARTAPPLVSDNRRGNLSAHLRPSEERFPWGFHARYARRDLHDRRGSHAPHSIHRGASCTTGTNRPKRPKPATRIVPTFWPPLTRS